MNTLLNILLVIDIQNDFINGSLAIHEGSTIIEPINNFADIIRNSNGQVIFTRDWHPENTTHFNKWTHCVANTEGANFYHTLNIKSEDIIISKGMGDTDGYSAWEGVTNNGQTLQNIIEPESSLDTVRVFISGLATDYCVKATAMDIASYFSNHNNVILYLLVDAIRAINPNNEQKAINAMNKVNITSISTDDAKEMLLNQDVNVPPS